MTKRYLKLFIEKIVINLPKVKITAKSDVALTVLENKKAVSTGVVLTAMVNCLPGTASNPAASGITNYPLYSSKIFSSKYLLIPRLLIFLSSSMASDREEHSLLQRMCQGPLKRLVVTDPP